jgi:hypothetical protein
MPKKMHPDPTPVANAASLPGKTALRWGAWPAPQVRLSIVDLKGSYSFVQPFPCGDWDAVQVVAWHERDNPAASRIVIGADRVYQPEQSVAKKSKGADLPINTLASPAPSPRVRQRQRG